jgi:iron complex transport system substrate-binding protein
MPFAQRHRAVVLALSIAALVGGCAAPAGSAAPAASAPRPTTVSPPSPSTVPSPTPAAFPTTVTDDEGTAVEIAAEPKTIVSLTPANTEIVFAVGAGDRVVATDDGSDYPESAAGLPHVASFDSVDVEKVVALQPDLVVAGGLGFTPADAIKKLRDLGIPVVVTYASSVDGVYKDIDTIGQATGTNDTATALTTDMKAQIDAISSAVSSQSPKPRVFYDIGYDPATGAIYAPADKSFLAEMVTLAGADTITTGDPNTYEIPLETLITKDPQVIVLGVNPFYSPTPDEVAARPGWKTMTAVKDGQIRPVHDTEITRPGPRLPIGMRDLAGAIWPDMTLPAAS